MIRRLRWIASGFVLCVGAELAAAQTLTATGNGEPALLLRICNLASVPDDVLIRAEQHVRLIYRKAAIQLLWRDCDDSLPSAAEAGLQLIVVIAGEPSARQISSLVPGEAGFALGHNGEEPRRAYVVADLVKKTAATLAQITFESNQEAEAFVLGCVIAHETGHLLLASHAHSLVGIMSPRMRIDDLARGVLPLFVPEQGASMRATLRRVSSLPSSRR